MICVFGPTLLAGILVGMAAKQTKPPRYPVLKFLMQWHIDHVTGWVEPLDEKGRAKYPGAKRNSVYRAEIAGRYGRDRTQFDKICAGNSGADIAALLGALGYTAEGQLRDHARWELLAATGSTPQPELYQAELADGRARLAERFPQAIAPHLPRACTMSGAGSGAVAPSGATTAGAPTPERSTQLKRVCKRLREPGCSSWLHALALRCDLDWPHPALASQAEVVHLVACLRTVGAEDRLGPLDTLSAALIDVRKWQGTLERDAYAALSAAAQALFALCFADLVVAERPSLDLAGLRLLASDTPDLLAAVALLDDALGHSTEFDRASGAAGARAGAVAIEVRDLMTDRDHSPGLLPGRVGEVGKQDIAAWVMPFFEGTDVHGHRHADADDSHAPTDSQLKHMLERLARQRDRRLRAAVDLNAEGAAHQLEQAKALAMEIGLPVVTFGASPPAELQCRRSGAVHLDLQALEVSVAAFLTNLEDLRPRAV